MVQRLRFDDGKVEAVPQLTGLQHVADPLEWTQLNAAVGTPKHYFSRTRFNAGSVQNFRERHARPFRRANGS
jgi:hypothetical protein